MTAALLLLACGAAVAALVAVLMALRARDRARELAADIGRVADGDLAAGMIDAAGGALEPVARAVRRLDGARGVELRALREERDERERILAHMSDGVALLDAQDRVRHMNHRFAELTGLPRPVATGTPFADAVRVAGLLELARASRDAGRVLERQLTLWAHAERPIRAEATPLPAVGVPGVLLVLQDLSEPERLDRMRRDFVANVSHELRTPLTSLRGYAETLLAGGLDDAENRERFVTVIRDQAVRLQAMTEDLLSLAALERPDATLECQDFDVRALLVSVAAASRDEAARRGLVLRVEPGDPLHVTAERARVEQAVTNLADNAIKYSERGTVTLRAAARDGRVWIEVEDTGPGIAPEHHARLFERFYRVDPARSRDRGGTGLGLAIVKHIAELHGGEVSLTSEPGRGSVFRIALPEPSTSRDG